MRATLLTPVFLCASLNLADAGSFMKFDSVVNQDVCQPTAILKDFETGTPRRFAEAAELDSYYKDEVLTNRRMNEIDRRLTLQAIEAAKKGLNNFFEPGCMVI